MIRLPPSKTDSLIAARSEHWLPGLLRSVSQLWSPDKASSSSDVTFTTYGLMQPATGADRPDVVRELADRRSLCTASPVKTGQLRRIARGVSRSSCDQVACRQAIGLESKRGRTIVIRRDRPISKKRLALSMTGRVRLINRIKVDAVRGVRHALQGCGKFGLTTRSYNWCTEHRIVLQVVSALVSIMGIVQGDPDQVRRRRWRRRRRRRRWRRCTSAERAAVECRIWSVASRCFDERGEVRCRR